MTPMRSVALRCGRRPSVHVIGQRLDALSAPQPGSGVPSWSRNSHGPAAFHSHGPADFHSHSPAAFHSHGPAA